MSRAPRMKRTLCAARWMRALAALAPLALLSAPAPAQEGRLVRLVIPAPPGGSLDTTGRMLAQRMAVQTGETWIVENRSGGGTIVATEFVMRAPPDGRVLLYHATGIAMLQAMQKLPYSPIEELAPVIQVSSERYSIVVPASSPATSLKTLEQFAQSRPDGLNCAAVPGVGTVGCAHLRNELRGKSTTIPFQGVTPAIQSLLGGHTDVTVLALEAAQRLMETGRVRVLAISGRKGVPPSFAQLPVISDYWPDVKIDGVTGVFAPLGTPPARMRELNRELNRLLADPETAAAMRESGQAPVGGTPEQFGIVLRRTSDYYSDVIRRLDLAPK